MSGILFITIPGAFYLFLVFTWHALRHYLIGKSSGIPDLPFLQHRRSDDQRIKGNVIVCGGSIAGLLAARVCLDFFERVIIVEPEAWLVTEEGRRPHGWEQKQTRARVMQYKSLQGNQAMLLQGLSQLFPNFREECKRSRISILPGDFKTTFAGTYMKVPLAYFKNKLPETLFTSRQGLETLIRRLVLGEGKSSRIEQIVGIVTGIVPDPTDRSRIRKVEVRTATGMEEIDVVLVADCTGITRAGVKWLERSGYGYAKSYPKGKLPLSELKISFDQKLQYSSIVYSLTPSLRDRIPFPGGLVNAGAVYTYLEDQPSLGRRFFVVTKPDGDRLMLFGGQSGDAPPKLHTLDDMQEYALSMVPFRDPMPGWVLQIIEMLKEVEHTAVPSQVRVPGTAYIRYHKAVNLPSNFVALGDSVMSVDPTFSQGCTKALMGALSLHNVLRGVKTAPSSPLPSTFSERFFSEHFDKTDQYWQTTRLMDYGIPTTVPLPGESLSSGKSIRTYLRRMQILAITDEQAGLAVYNAALGLGSPLDAFHPALVIKVLWDMLKRPNL